MKKALSLICIASFITLNCEGQNDTIIYYGPNGAISQDSVAIVYRRVVSVKKKKKQSQKYRLWTHRKHEGVWSEPSTFDELIQVNDSTYQISYVRQKKSTVQLRRVVDKLPKGFYIRDYSPSGHLLEEGYSKSIFPLHKMGQYQSYYSNGKTKKIAAYLENEEVANENWNKDGEKTLDNVFTMADQMPEFQGGEHALLNYLARKIKYPQAAKEYGLAGIVYISFVIMEDGSVNQIHVLRGIGGGCDVESIKVVRDMPNWKPGTHKDKPVRIIYTLPVRFVLR